MVGIGGNHGKETKWRRQREHGKEIKGDTEDQGKRGKITEGETKGKKQEAGLERPRER
jgi:hypothetical protein